jgi:hypothetical protein
MRHETRTACVQVPREDTKAAGTHVIQTHCSHMHLCTTYCSRMVLLVMGHSLLSALRLAMFTQWPLVFRVALNGHQPHRDGRPAAHTHTHTRRKYLGDILMADPPAGRHARIHGPSDDSGHPSHSTQYTVHSAQRTAMDATARHVLLVLATHFLQDLNWGQLGLGVGVTLARKRSASAIAPHTEPGRHREVTSLHAGWYHSPRVTHASDATHTPADRAAKRRHTTEVSAIARACTGN